MPPTRVLIVDDEPLARDAVRVLIDAEPDMVVCAEARNGTEAIAGLQRGDIDLVFLDVQMPESTGLDVVRAIGPERMPVTIFVTAYDEYAVAAFEAQALDYLLKPFEDERFRSALSRARRQLRQQDDAAAVRRLTALVGELSGAGAHPAKLSIKTAGRRVFVEPNDIDVIEAADYCVRIHCSDRTHLVRESMNSFEKRLDGDMFVRIHRSTIVNLNRVREVQPLYHGDYVVVMEDGSTHRLSRSRRAELEQRLSSISR